MTTCPGCKGRFAKTDGPMHDYLSVSAGCWARFGQALALQYSDHRYWRAHQLLTDAYALQHSRNGDPRAIRSAHVHLAALYAQIVLGQSEARVIALRRTLSKRDFKWSQPWPVPSVSIADVDLAGPDRHFASVKKLALGVLSDWSGFEGLAKRLCSA
ncbi:DUF5946 family protein [Aliiroseovarius sp. S2029]|uniref:DUF5946 family protein n=1 Tax=Aliiroseovarius sp. S2029 TaxID=2936988 RepID=UPI0020C029CC|nr:DUF5946 family protein [Aliiroseovarius sp. S2029]MCK8484206.1 DUF5946 family protein [Aliiroseovarius sp. S2029]